MRYQQVFKKHIFSKATDLANCVLLGDQASNPAQPLNTPPPPTGTRSRLGPGQLPPVSFPVPICKQGSWPFFTDLTGCCEDNKK